MLKDTPLLSNKPVIYAANLSEADFTGDINSNKEYQAVCAIAKEENAEVLPICAQIEAEISGMSDEDKELFLADMHLESSGLARIIKTGYHLLGLISYLTAGPQEVRAWTITRGTKAPQAAGKIHTDFEKGFIRAEIVAFDDLMKCGSMAAAKEKLKRSLGSFAVPLLSILLAFLIGGIIMAALGADPFTAVKFLFQGAFGSRANIGTTLNKATPLMFTALCACFAYKCGVFNLGGEGQFLMGSIAAFLTAYFSGLTGFAGILLALLAGTLAGGIWGLIPGVLKITRGQNEMIISIMLNYVATLFMGVLYTSWIRDENIPQTPAVSKLVQLPRVISGMRFTWGFVLALVVGLVMYYVLFWTSGGFKLRAVGYNMTASRFNGIPVKRYILTSFIISGAIAGLGGGAELLGTQFRLINGFGAGYGFDGVAMALIGQLHPIATVIVALFFAALRVGSTTMQAATGVPTSVSDIIQALVIVFSVAGMALTKLPEFESWKSRLFSGKRKAGDK